MNNKDPELKFRLDIIKCRLGFLPFFPPPAKTLSGLLAVSRRYPVRGKQWGCYNFVKIVYLDQVLFRRVMNLVTAGKVSGISKVALPTKSMESGQQPFYFTGMFLLKLSGHVTKLSINSYWLLVFILLSVINFIGWKVYSCLVH